MFCDEKILKVYVGVVEDTAIRRWKKLILVMLTLWLMLSIAGCGTKIVRTVCDCDCCECGYDWEEPDRYDDPGEYEGWID